LLGSAVCIDTLFTVIVGLTELGDILSALIASVVSATVTGYW